MNEDQEKEQGWYEKYRLRNDKKYGERLKGPKERLLAQYEKENRIKDEEIEKARKINEARENEQSQSEAGPPIEPKLAKPEISQDLKDRLHEHKKWIDQNRAELERLSTKVPTMPTPIPVEPQKTPYQKAIEWMKRYKESFEKRHKEQKRAQITPVEFEKKPEIDHIDDEAIS